MRRLAPLLLLLALGAPAATADAAPTARGWEYRVRFDEGLGTATVELCFRRFLPKRLVVSGGKALTGFTFQDPEPGGARLEPRADGSVVPVGLGPGGCVRYRVDLRKVDGRIRHVGSDVLVPPRWLFLRPAFWPSDADVGVRFEMPPDTHCAVPWPRDESGRRRIDKNTLELTGLAAFGRFAPDTLEIAGAAVDVVVLDVDADASRAGIHAWLRAAVLAVADLYGRFPEPRVTALVQPVHWGRGDEPVLFGEAMRAGGAHVRLLLSQAAEDERLPGEWVAIHELTHLGMPWTYDAEAWMQEGFVTYYQEVLRARAGFLTAQEAWQNIHDGFRRGLRRGGERPLADESRTMRADHGYHRVYWAGAAIALLIDLELRKRTSGARSLDDVMRFMHRTAGGTRAPRSGLDLLRAADRWLGLSVCGPIAERWLRARDFPDLDPAYAALGLRPVGGRVEFAERGAQVAERARIMRPGGR